MSTRTIVICFLLTTTMRVDGLDRIICHRVFSELSRQVTPRPVLASDNYLRRIIELRDATVSSLTREVRRFESGESSDEILLNKAKIALDAHGAKYEPTKLEDGSLALKLSNESVLSNALNDFAAFMHEFGDGISVYYSPGSFEKGVRALYDTKNRRIFLPHDSIRKISPTVSAIHEAVHGLIDTARNRGEACTLSGDLKTDGTAEKIHYEKQTSFDELAARALDARFLAFQLKRRLKLKPEKFGGILNDLFSGSETGEVVARHLKEHSARLLEVLRNGKAGTYTFKEKLDSPKKENEFLFTLEVTLEDGTVANFDFASKELDSLENKWSSKMRSGDFGERANMKKQRDDLLRGLTVERLSTIQRLSTDLEVQFRSLCEAVLHINHETPSPEDLQVLSTLSRNPYATLNHHLPAFLRSRASSSFGQN